MSCLDSPINCKKKKTSECLHVGKFVGALDGYRVGTLVGTSETNRIQPVTPSQTGFSLGTIFYEETQHSNVCRFK